MNILFFSMDGSENVALQDVVTGKLRELHQLNNGISQAQVDFKERSGKTGVEKVCRIDLTNYGNMLSVSRSSVGYEQAAKEAITELKRMLESARISISS